GEDRKLAFRRRRVEDVPLFECFLRDLLLRLRVRNIKHRASQPPSASQVFFAGQWRTSGKSRDHQSFAVDQIRALFQHLRDAVMRRLQPPEFAMDAVKHWNLYLDLLPGSDLFNCLQKLCRESYQFSLSLQGLDH